MQKRLACLVGLLFPAFPIELPEDWTGSSFRALRCKIIFPERVRPMREKRSPVDERQPESLAH
jgi:hypothetical protein